MDILRIISANHFALRQQRDIPEMQGTLWELEHPGSGAKLAWLQRQDENMTFTIGFRTIPEDSTGVFHILEHSVLAGSDKFPVKEPFVELLKSSLQTFLNAMTYPDKTVYPVSSRNKQDFHNLMEIYLDAVFHPTAVKCSNVFRQEGWRLEFDEKNEPMFQGVVYNEMKGAHSDVARQMERAMMQGLFPDTCYAVESGGDPEHIPELSYEQFVSEHRKYYHPSNARIVLDGDIDLDGCLRLLDRVLGDYRKEELDFPIPMQRPLPFRQMRIPYEVGVEEDCTDKTNIAFGKLLCRFDDPVTLHAAELLADYLAGDSEAPMKRAILDAGLGADFQMSLEDGMQQAWFGWQVWNTQEGKLPAIRETIQNVGRKLVQTGLDRQRLLGCYNSMAFRLLDRDGARYPRGLLESLNMIEPWLYGGDPAQNLRYRGTLEALKEKMDSGYLEKLLEEFLDESEGFLAILVPDPTAGETRIRAEKQRAKEYWAHLTAAEQQSLQDELERVHRWQQAPDSPEALATIPILQLEDVNAQVKPLPCKLEKNGEIPVLVHEIGNDLAYVRLHFDATDVSAQEMPLLHFAGSLLGTLATENHSAAVLQTAILQHWGELGFHTSVHHVDADHHRTIFTAGGVCLGESLEQAIPLMVEILNSTVFTDTDAAAKLLRQKKAANQQRLISAGNSFAAARVAARQSSAGAAREYYGGCEYIRWVNGQCAGTETETEELLHRIRALLRRILVANRLTISVSANASRFISTLAAAFPAGAPAPESAEFQKLPDVREGIRIPAGVGYAAKGANIEQFGEKFSGHMYPLSTLLTFEYLWSEVRVKGGAYGTGFRVNMSNDLIATSYRDPSPGKTLDIFDHCADAVEQLCSGGNDLTKYILGAMTDADPLLSGMELIATAEGRYFRRMTQADAERYRRELLDSTPEQLCRLATLLRSAAEKGSYCIVGGAQQLDNCGDLLEKIIEF